jgi:excisionase family DNA binding protein
MYTPMYNSDMNEEFYTPKEVANQLKTNYRTILREIKRGNLKAHKVGNLYVIKESDLQKYIDKGTVVSPLKVSVAVVKKDNQFLLVKRRKKEGKLQWQFPTGTLKYAEDSSIRAEIECLEETSIHCKAIKKLGKRVHPDTNVIIYYWICEYIQGEPKNLDDYENEEVKWVDADKVLDLTTSDVYPPIKEYIRAIYK